MEHKGIADGRWFELSLMEQMANVGCDVDRAIRWKNKGNVLYSDDALKRAFDLLFLTIKDPKNKKRLKEVMRVKELLIDYFMDKNIYFSTDEMWHKYFLDYNYMAALERGR
jgi:hypothetical protein